MQHPMPAKPTLLSATQPAGSDGRVQGELLLLLRAAEGVPEPEWPGSRVATSCAGVGAAVAALTLFARSRRRRARCLGVNA